MNKEIQVNQEYELKKEFEEKVFARCVQILDEKGIELVPANADTKNIDITFTAYDAIEDRIKSSDYFKETPFFVDDELKRKVILMRILEEVTESVETSIADIVGAIINPMLCKGKELKTRECEENEILTITLIKN